MTCSWSWTRRHRGQRGGEAFEQALTSLPEIEACLAATRQFTGREAEVMARVLFGISTVGIAIDLGLSEQTVKSYRKRAYQRLSFGSERDLLNWYLKAWSLRRRSRGDK
ncbi:LuxR C-terminal-related transcriptional regulator [Caenimonas aquaedulcis]|uniref:HTH luxR-type domain-containing protein n=1 Tax=Caenimonas aquaedulcis TaxID=2793270 RepID=A0A931H406_9BURK|nr:LuxR C-terminal-related transcriptional regulator [Caenimonas aquaedulcis]MBG9388065.1 hypothetical protein [Caenimonas aquaedulcis]